MYRPLLRRILWLLFAVLFFYAGLYFTEWLLEPDTFAGSPLRWALIALFPFLVPLFFYVNGRLGCGGGSCGISSKSGDPEARTDAGTHIMRMPGA